MINCLEMTNKPSASTINEQVRVEILKVSGCDSISDFKALEAQTRNGNIRILKERGFSIRELSMLTGIGYNIIQLA